MSNGTTGVLTAPVSNKRVVGRIAGAEAGPTIIVMAGIHGNEPSGLKAARSVLAALEAAGGLGRGELVVLAGNLSALAERTRFIDKDLNRQWTPANIERLRRSPAQADEAAELREQRELHRIIGETVEQARGQIHFLDLHTSSAEGRPFLTVGDTLRNRKFAMRFPLPLILGLEEQVDGALLEYLNNFGIVTLGVEGGQHDRDESADYHEAVLWLALEALGLIDAGSIPGLQGFRQLLVDAAVGLPRVVEVRCRHAIESGDEFCMNPGFTNFKPVRKGMPLARDKHGLVLAPEDGLVLLPLYQGKGDDGFFIAREVRIFWLHLSAVLRRLRLSAAIRLLPGVRRHSSHEDVLVVNTRVARWYPLEVFHLFGFRKLRREGTTLLVSRRRHDLAHPRQISFS